MRLLCAAALTVTVGLYFGLAADSKDPAADELRAGRLKQIKKRFAEESVELRKRAETATDRATLAGIREEQRELAVITGEKLIGLAEDEPKDAVAYEALEYAVQTLPIAGSYLDKAFPLLIEHHIGNPKIKGLLMSATRYQKAGQKLLEAVADKATDKEIKAVALFYLGTSVAGDLNRVTDEQAAVLIAQAEALFQKAVKEAPDAMVGKVKLATAVENELAGMKSLQVGTAAPEVEGENLLGKKVPLSSYRGKVVLLDIWATWCPPCRAMIPHERELVQKMERRPFVLLSVSADSAKSDLTDFLETEPMPWAHWWDGTEGPVLKKFRVGAFPTLYLIDSKGVIRKKWKGSPGNDVLDREVEALVKETEGGR